MRLGILCVLCLAGCASVGTVPVGDKQVRAKPADCQLDVFGAEADVKRPFEVVCLINSETGTTLFHRHSIEAAMEKLRPKACSCGADAIVIVDAEKHGMNWTGYGKGEVKVKAIVYTD